MEEEGRLVQVLLVEVVAVRVDLELEQAYLLHREQLIRLLLGVVAQEQMVRLQEEVMEGILFFLLLLLLVVAVAVV